MRLRPFVLTAAITLLLAAQAPAQELPDVVSALPADAQAAIIIPSLSELSDQLANFESAADLGVGEFQDAMGLFLRELGLINGVNREGAMMVVLRNVTKPGDAAAASVLLIPTEDYAVLVQTLGGDPEQPTTAITLPDGSTGFCKLLSNYAVMSGDEQALQAIAEGDGLAALTDMVGEAGIKTVTTSQLSVAINVKGIAPEMLAPRLSALIELTMQQIDGMLAIDIEPTPWKPMIDVLSNKAAQGTTGLVIGVSFSDKGVTYTEASLLKEGSELAESFLGAGQANTSAALANLPDRPMVFAVAGDTQAVKLGDLADQFGGILGLAPEHALGPIRQPLNDMLSQATSSATALYAVPGGPEKVMSHWFTSATVLETADPVAQRAAVKKFITSLNGAELPMENGEPIKLIAMYRDNDRQIDNAQVDTFTLRMTVPQSAQTGPLTQAIALLGSAGFTGHVTAGTNHVIITTVDDNTMTSELLRGLGRSMGLGHAGTLDDIRGQHLPADLTVQAYISFGGIADSLNPFLQLMGTAQPVSVPANLPPIAMGMTSDGKSVRSVMFVPSATIKLLATEDFDLSSPNEDPNQPRF